MNQRNNDTRWLVLWIVIIVAAYIFAGAGILYARGWRP